MVKRGVVAVGIMCVLIQTAGATTYTAKSFDEIVSNAAKLEAGDSLIIAAGTYNAPKADSIHSIKLSQSGVKGKRIFFGTVGNDRAVIDFGFPYKASNFQSTAQGIRLYGDYWYIRGITITHAGDNGMLVESAPPYATTPPSTPKGGSYNIIDCCTFCENNDAGLQFKNLASYDTVINCDSYANYDYDDDGGDADGFAPKQNCGPGIYFFGCRAWLNGDDGWDAYFKYDIKTKESGKVQWSSRVRIVVDYCICYKNGYEKDGKTRAGNGNGFKMGSKEYANDFTCIRSLAVENYSKGFDPNNNTGDMKVLNCSGSGNGTDFALSAQNSNAIGSAPGGTSNASGTAADFQSTTVPDIISARNADGSLSDKVLSYMAPKSGDTKFVDKGSSVSGYDVHAQGTPDIGWIEKGYTNARWQYLPVKSTGKYVNSYKAKSFINSITTLTAAATVNYTAFSNGELSIVMYDCTGKKVIESGITSVLAGSHNQTIDVRSLNAGNYMCKIKFAGVDGAIEAHAIISKY